MRKQPDTLDTYVEFSSLSAEYNEKINKGQSEDWLLRRTNDMERRPEVHSSNVPLGRATASLFSLNRSDSTKRLLSTMELNIYLFNLRNSSPPTGVQLKTWRNTSH